MTNFTLDNSLGFIINRTARRLKYELHQTFKQNGYDITPEQWAILNRLWEQEGLSQVELAEQTFKDKPNVTRMLNVMQRKGLVIRQRDENDRRAFKVYLKDKLIPLAVEILERGQQNLTQNDVELLANLLNTIYTNFD